MRKLSIFFLSLVLLLGFINFQVNPAFASTLTLRPNAVGTYQTWALTDTTHYGATSDQSDSTWLLTVDTTSKETEHLTDTSQTGTINSVTAYIRAYAVGIGAVEKAVILWKLVAEWESAAKTISRVAFTDYSEVRLVSPASEAAWTWAEVNSLQVGARASALGAEDDISCSEFWIVVDYTVAGTNYVADLSNSLTTTWQVQTQAAFQIVPTKTISTTWNSLTQWNAIADFTQAITSSWSNLANLNTFVDLSQTGSLTMQLLTQWNGLVGLSQSLPTTWQTLIQSAFNTNLFQTISSAWAVLTQTSFNIIPTQSLTSTWQILMQWDAFVSLNQSISSAWQILTQWTTNIDLTQSVINTWNMLTDWDAILNVSQSLTTSWNILVNYNTFVNLSQTVSSTWQVLTQWDAIADSSQAITSSWTILTKTSFNIIDSLSTTFTWMVDVVHTVIGGQQYFADLSQSISTMWNLIIQWNAISDLSQSISTTCEILVQWNTIIDFSQPISATWNIITQTTYNIIDSFSLSTSWVIDVVHTIFGGQQYFADLSQSITTSWSLLTQWTSNVNLSGSLTTTWTILTQTVFNTQQTLQITTSWIIDLFHSMFVAPTFPPTPSDLFPNFDITLVKFPTYLITLSPVERSQWFDVTIYNKGEMGSEVIVDWFIQDAEHQKVFEASQSLYLNGKESRQLSLSFPLPTKMGEYRIFVFVSEPAQVGAQTQTVFTVHTVWSWLASDGLIVLVLMIAVPIAVFLGWATKEEKWSEWFE